MTMPNHRTWAEISLARIESNYRVLSAEVAPETLLAPVVKADAYRHGAARVAARLEQAGATWFAVSNAEEGIALRLSGIRARILLMGDFLPYERQALLEFHLTPVVHSLTRLRELDDFAAMAGTHVPYHFKIDTGMGRLGSRANLEDVVAGVRACRHATLEGLMTHFASAANFATTQTADQITAFQAAVADFRAAGITVPFLHLSSSAPVVYGLRPAYATLVRPGLALYGYFDAAVGAAPRSPLAVEPALTWKARVLEIKELPAGAPVGYGARWRASQPTRLAVIAAGYADGIPHPLSNRGHVIAAGRLVSIVGAVSMDLTTVDVTAVPELATGDAVTLLGSEGNVRYDARDIAGEAGIISYAVLCGLGNRVARIYTG